MNKSDLQTAEQHRRYETLTDIFASQALEGLEPSERDKELAWGYIRGELSVEDILAISDEEFGIVR